MCVDLEGGVTAVHQHPQPALGVKGQVQGAVGQGESAVWNQPLSGLLVHSEELKRGHSEDTRGDSSAGSFPLPPTSTVTASLRTSKNIFNDRQQKNSFQPAEVKNCFLFYKRSGVVLGDANSTVPTCVPLQKLRPPNTMKNTLLVP